MKQKVESAEAVNHINDMADRYTAEIKAAAVNSHIYGPETPDHINGDNSPRSTVSMADSVTALRYADGKTAILNFADYTRRGGLYLYGSHAQEEALCGGSTLWNILTDPVFDDYFAWNKKNQKDYLYENRAIYTPDVDFETKLLGHVKADVLSCAAPNKNAAGRYKHVSVDEAKKAMKQRIIFIRNVLEQEHVDTCILGAYGCGVFGNSTNYVAECFASVFADANIKNVVYALPQASKRSIFEKYIH